jgi:hypothetical protein
VREFIEEVVVVEGTVREIRNQCEALWNLGCFLVEDLEVRDVGEENVCEVDREITKESS